MANSIEGVTFSVYADDKGLVTEERFLNIFKALNEASHTIFVVKLHLYRICGTLLRWWFNFLSSNHLKLLSTTATVLSDLPQG